MALEFSDGETLVIQAHLPEVNPDRDIEIWISHDVLHIRARSDVDADARHRSDLRFGTFVRDIALPTGTSEERIRASFVGGQLEVRAPLGGGVSVQARRVPIERRPLEPLPGPTPPGAALAQPRHRVPDDAA